MSIWNALKDAVAGFDPLDWYLACFILAGLILGIGSGYFRARKIQPKGFKWRMVRHEVLWSTINIVAASFTLGTFKKFLDAHGLIAFNPAPASVWILALEYGIYFLGFDAYFYWMHRLMHVEPIYTWVHKTHHFSTSTNPLTSISINPLEAFINGIFVSVYTAGAVVVSTYVPGASPLHTETMALILPTTIIMGFYVHLGFEFLPRWWNRSWLTKWFISATFHDQHHRYFRGNFGGYTTIWDRLCGTLRVNFEKDFHAVTTRSLEPIYRRARQSEPAN